MLLNKYGLLGYGLGKMGSRQPATEVSALTPPGSPVYWWDGTDVSTLWEDEAKTTNITADAEQIATITSKGSSTIDLTQDDSAEMPIWDATGINSVPAAYFRGTDAWANTAPETVVEVDMTVAFVFAMDDTVSTELLLNWPDTSGIRAFVADDEMVTSHAGVASTSGEGIGTETWRSNLYLLDAEGPDQRTNDYSWVAANVTAEDATGTAPDLDDDIIVGALTETGGTAYAGQFGEIVVWDIVLTAQEIADWKTYVAAKYGITWS